MKFSWNVVQTTLALTICSGLLAACQDRGSFEARVFSEAEKKNFCAKSENTQACVAHGLIADPAKAQTQTPKDGGSLPAPNQNSGPQTKVIPDATPAPTPAPSDKASTPAEKSAPQASNDKKAPKVKPLQATEERSYGPGAESKVIEEFRTQVDLIASSKKAVSLKDDELTQLVKGINISVTGSASKLLLNLEALVMIGDDLKKLTVTDAEISFNKDGKLNKPLMARLENPLSPEKQSPLNDSLYVSATCSNEACDTVYVRLEFSIGNGQRPVVFALDKSTGYDIAQGQSNLKRVSFEKAMEELLTPAPSATPAKEEKPKDEAKKDVQEQKGTEANSATPQKEEKPAVKETPAASAEKTVTKPQVLASLNSAAGINTAKLAKPPVKTTTGPDGKVVRAHVRPGMKKETAVPAKAPAPTVKAAVPAKVPVVAAKASPVKVSTTTPAPNKVTPTATPQPKNAVATSTPRAKTFASGETPRVGQAQALATTTAKVTTAKVTTPIVKTAPTAKVAAAPATTTTAKPTTAPTATATAATPTPVVKVHHRPGMINKEPSATETAKVNGDKEKPQTTATAPTAQPSATVSETATIPTK